MGCHKQSCERWPSLCVASHNLMSSSGKSRVAASTLAQLQTAAIKLILHVQELDLCGSGRLGCTSVCPAHIFIRCDLFHMAFAAFRIMLSFENK